MKINDSFEIISDPSVDKLLSTDEVMHRLGTAKLIVQKLIKYKFLPSVKFGRVNRISAFRLNNFIAACEGLDILAILAEYETQTTEEGKQNIRDMIWLGRMEHTAG